MQTPGAQNQVTLGKTEVLICIGAAVGANCIPCFEHLYEKALEVGLTAEEIEMSKNLAAQVKKGAHLALENSINELLGNETRYAMQCSEADSKSCCG